jgi:hydroxypyruvate reductase
MIQNRHQLARTAAHELALDCIAAGIDATRPDHAIADSLDREGNTLTIADSTLDLDAYSDVVVVGGGKAGAQMARATEDLLSDRIGDGVIVTNDPAETDQVSVVEGSHPTPNADGQAGAEKVLDVAEAATADQLVICLVSGGGSALLPAPAEGVDLADLQSVTNDLLESGASIGEINAVRKHLSAIKGGQLAKVATPATVIGLVVSDVVGNDLSVIASGPITPDESTYRDARDTLDRYDIAPPKAVSDRLNRGLAGEIAETPGPEHSAFDRTHIHVLADGMTALDAAASVVEDSAYTPVILSTQVEGEARESAMTHAAIANEARATGNPADPPVVFLSGGETTVTVRGDGSGGPNQEFALGGALSLDGGIVLGSVDTDGSDGATEAAGGLVTRTAVDDPDRARDALADNDAYTYLRDRDALVLTGPTGTNVNDLRVVVVPQ